MHGKLKDLRLGLFLDRKFKPEEKVDLVELERKTMEYLYKDANGFYMMDPESFDQIPLNLDLLDAFDLFLQANMKLPVEFLDGEPVNVIFPEFVDLEVISTPPSLSSRFCQTCAFDKGCRHPAESCPARKPAAPMFSPRLENTASRSK